MSGVFGTVVQTQYRPMICAGVPGQISHETSCDVSSWIVSDAAGIGFGKAVSGLTKKPKYCTVAGTATAARFLGITVIDVTQTGIPLDPLSGTEVAADTFPQYSNASVLTRGRVFVTAQANVYANDPVWFDAAGALSNVTGGSAASGSITFTQQPTAGQIITFEANNTGQAVTFVASGAIAGSYQVNIGDTLGETVYNLWYLLDSVTTGATQANIDTMLYEYYPPSPAGAGQGIGANTLMYGAATVGTAGNSITVTTNVTGATVSGTAGALAGGLGASVQITGAYWLDNVVAGDVGRIALGVQQ